MLFVFCKEKIKNILIKSLIFLSLIFLSFYPIVSINAADIVTITASDYDNFRNQVFEKGYKYTAEARSLKNWYNKGAAYGAGTTQSMANQLALESCTSVYNDCVITRENYNQTKVEPIKEKDQANKNSNKKKDFKVFYVEREIANKNLLPNILYDGKKIIAISNFDRSLIKKILLENDKVLIITPKFISNSLRGTEEKYIGSKYALGSERIVNNEYINLQRNLDLTSAEVSRKQAGLYRARQAAANYGYCGANWGCIAQQAAAIAAAEEWESSLNITVSQRDGIINQLNNTPAYIDRINYQNYNYKITTIKPERKVTFNIVEINNRKIVKYEVINKERDNFQIISNVNLSDPSYKEIMNSSKTIRDVEKWENHAFKDVEVSELNTKEKKIDIKETEILTALELKKNFLSTLFK